MHRTSQKHKDKARLENTKSFRMGAQNAKDEEGKGHKTGQGSEEGETHMNISPQAVPQQGRNGLKQLLAMQSGRCSLKVLWDNATPAPFVSACSFRVRALS